MLLSLEENSNYKTKCAVPGRTELDNDDLELDSGSKCEGTMSTVVNHLYTMNIKKIISKGTS